MLADAATPTAAKTSALAAYISAKNEVARDLATGPPSSAPGRATATAPNAPDATDATTLRSDSVAGNHG